MEFHYGVKNYFFQNIDLQIPLPIVMHTLVKALPSSLPLMMLPALDQKLPFFRVLILAVITVHIVKMLVLSVYHVSTFMDKIH